MKIYLVAFTGGLEDPEFEFFQDEKRAQAKYDEWSSDMILDEGFRVDMLTYDSDIIIKEEAL